MAKPKRQFTTFPLIQINSLLTVPRGLTGGLPESTKRPGMLPLPVLPAYYVIFCNCSEPGKIS